MALKTYFAAASSRRHTKTVEGRDSPPGKQALSRKVRVWTVLSSLHLQGQDPFTRIGFDLLTMSHDSRNSTCITVSITAEADKQANVSPSAPARRPPYPISVAAELAGVRPRTLSMYAEQQLLIPTRRGTWRFCSDNDLAWIRVVRYLPHEGGINIAGWQRLLALIPCTEIRKLRAERCSACPKAKMKSMPCWAVPATRGDRRCHECEACQSARH